MIDVDGGCSGCRRRSLPLGPPSTAAFHQRVEDLEADRLDKVADLGEERFVGIVRGTSTAGRTRVRVSSVDLQGESKREGWMRERGE